MEKISNERKSPAFLKIKCYIYLLKYFHSPSNISHFIYVADKSGNFLLNNLAESVLQFL